MNRTLINENTNTNELSSAEEGYITNKTKKKMNLNEYEKLILKTNTTNQYNKRSSSNNIFGSILKFFYLTFKIFIEKVKNHKAILIFLILSVIFFKRKNLMHNVRFFLHFFGRRISSSSAWFIIEIIYFWFLIEKLIIQTWERYLWSLLILFNNIIYNFEIVIYKDANIRR